MWEDKQSEQKGELFLGFLSHLEIVWLYIWEWDVMEEKEEGEKNFWCSVLYFFLPRGKIVAYFHFEDTAIFLPKPHCVKRIFFVQKFNSK